MKYLVVILALFTLACDPPCKKWEDRVRHVEAVPDEWVYWPSSSSAGGLSLTPYGTGISTGGGMHLVLGHAAYDTTDHVCVEREQVK